MEDKARPSLGRVKIDLSEFFSDERRFCFKCLDLDALRRVVDLKKFLQKETGVPDNVTLMLANSALFDTDNIRVIRDGDNLKLTKSRKSPCKTGMSNGHSSVADNVQSCSSAESTPNSSRAKNPPPSHEAENLNNEILEESLEWMKEPLPKRKRTRKRRGKKKNDNEPESDVPVEEEKVVVRPPPRIRTQFNADRKHIRFDNQMEVDNNGCNDEEVATNGHPVSETLDNLLVPKYPVVFKRTVAVKKEQPDCFQQLTDQQLFDMPPVTEKPKINDIITYRILFVGENYTPELSSWLVAKVVSDGAEGLGLQLLRGTNPMFKTGENKFDLEGAACVEKEDFMTALFEDLAMTRSVPPSGSQ